jgi:hypothetical protein
LLGPKNRVIGLMSITPESAIDLKLLTRKIVSIV